MNDQSPARTSPSRLTQDAVPIAPAQVAPAASAPQADASPAPQPPTEERALAPETTPTRKGAARTPPRRLVRRAAMVAALALALGLGLDYGLDWWRVGRFMVTTDDAYVQADTAVIAAKVTGYVADVAVKDNQPVKAGDLLARVDDGDYRLAVQAAADKVATQNATIDRIGAQIDAQQAARTQAQAQVASAEAAKALADASYDRVRTLTRGDVASKAQLDQAVADRARAEAGVAAARAAETGVTQGIDVLKAQKVEAERARAELETAKAKAERDLSFTRVVAPFDGVVGNKAVQPGQFVQPGQRLMALVPRDTLYVTANFKETQLASLKPGQKAKIEVDAMSGREVEGVVASIAPASGAQFSLLPPDNATGNFTKIVQRVPVRIAIPADVADRALLRPGLSVTTSVDTRDLSDTKAENAQETGATTLGPMQRLSHNLARARAFVAGLFGHDGAPAR